MPTDPYAILGLSKTATAGEIKQDYRKLARSSHPDLNLDDAGAEARFKAISAAHDLLKDPAFRGRSFPSMATPKTPTQSFKFFGITPALRAS